MNHDQSMDTTVVTHLVQSKHATEVRSPQSEHLPKCPPTSHC